MKLTMRLDGVGAALAKFKAAGGKIPVRVVSKAIKAGSVPLVQTSKANAPVDTGVLQKAMTAKVKSYRRGRFILAVIGPKARKYANGRNPANYAHLVEHGHRIAVGGRLNRRGRIGSGRVGGFVPGSGFMRRSAQASAAQAVRAFESSIRANLPGAF